MNKVVILNAHNHPERVRDTIDSIRFGLGVDKIILVIDGKGWNEFQDFSYPDTHIVCGYYHGVDRSPYKNFCVGMNKAYELFPSADWYIYTEFDVLFIYDNLSKDLETATKRGYVAVGFEHIYEKRSSNNWLAKEILNKPDLHYHKFIGALMCFSQYCIKSLMDVHFFHEVLDRTKGFVGDDFAKFDDYAVEEVLFPSAASAFGPLGGISENNGNYIVRFRPEIEIEELNSKVSIVHPVKSLKDPIRLKLRASRLKGENFYAGLGKIICILFHASSSDVLGKIKQSFLAVSSSFDTDDFGIVQQQECQGAGQITGAIANSVMITEDEFIDNLKVAVKGIGQLNIMCPKIVLIATDLNNSNYKHTINKMQRLNSSFNYEIDFHTFDYNILGQAGITEQLKKVLNVI